MPFILDTKSSNYNSLLKCLNRANLENNSGKHIVIPGVSSFDSLISNISDSDRAKIFSYEYVSGICAGAQVLFESSEEGKEAGLGLLKGRVKKLDKNSGVRIPHLGWNKIILNTEHSMAFLFDGIDLDNRKFYFSHSYCFPDSKDVLAYADYGERIPVVVAQNNIIAIQFHPEKSYNQGIQLLKNIFTKLC
jgi:glutamine amidotransferase